ncbi:MAG TPA: hypothetical protein VGN88_11225 [Phycisphaerae bacterium]|jgi:hypothetical protein
MGTLPRIGNQTLRALALFLTGALGLHVFTGATAFLGTPYSVTMSTHITGIGQSFTGSTGMMLEHDTQCTLSISVNTLGDEVLKSTTPGGGFLTTQYKITGIADGDAAWLDSTTFLSRTYSVPGNNITDNMTLWVQGTAPPNIAPEAGTYTAAIIITATF